MKWLWKIRKVLQPEFIAEEKKQKSAVSKPTAKMMICDLCNKELHPLDAHTGYIDNKLSCTHIDCWNKHYAKEDAENLMKELTNKLPDNGGC